ESVVAREVVDFQDYPRAPGLEFGNANLLQEAIVDVKGLSHQGRSQFSVAQVEENAVGMRDALRPELHFLLNVNSDASVVRRGPVANSGHTRQGATTGARGVSRFGRVVGVGTGIAFAIRRPLLARRLPRRTFHFVGVGVDFLHRGAGIIGQTVARIAMQKVFEDRARLFGIVEIVLVDLANRKERVEAVFAAGIFLAQEAVLFDGAAQNLVVVKAPPHLDHEFGGRYHARVRLRRGGRAEVNAAVRVDHALVFAASALSNGTAIESLPHAFRFGKLLTGPGVVVMDAGRCGNQR